MKQRLKVRVSGRVQGVGYRDFTRHAASRLGLTGYARNLPNGDVEVVAQGEQEALRNLLNHLRVGPPAAQVTEVDVEWSEPIDEFSTFTIRI